MIRVRQAMLWISIGLAFVLAPPVNAQIQTHLELRNPQADIRAAKEKGMPYSSDSFSENSRLQAVLQLSGDRLAETEFSRTVLKSAVDDSGTDLVYHQFTDAESFESLWRRGEKPYVGPDLCGGGLQRVVGGRLILRLGLLLKDPGNAARKIKELSGEVTLFAPKRDPKSTAIVKNFQSFGGKPIMSPLLSSVGVELNTLTTEQLEALDKLANRERQECGLAQAQAINKVPHVTFQIKDPNRKLVALIFQDAFGHEIEANGAWGSVSNDWMSFQFDSKLPKTARLVIYLAAQKSMIKVPFSFKNTPLP